MLFHLRTLLYYVSPFPANDYIAAVAVREEGYTQAHVYGFKNQ